jgi:hypothetical protein
MNTTTMCSHTSAPPTQDLTCHVTKATGSDTQCIICLESIRIDSFAVVHKACGISWHHDCFDCWRYSAVFTDPDVQQTWVMKCLYCRQMIDRPFPPRAPGSPPMKNISVHPCVCALLISVGDACLVAKSLPARETSNFYTTEKVARLLGHGFDDRIAQLAYQSLQLLMVNAWIEFNFDDLPDELPGHVRIIPYNYQFGVRAPACCMNYMLVKQETAFTRKTGNNASLLSRAAGYSWAKRFFDRLRS